MAEVRKEDLSLEGFLAWENARPERFERVGGVVRMMAGGTAEHDQIAINLASELHLRLRGSPCTVHGSNLKVVSPRGDVMYPDVFVRCGPARRGATAVDDPVLAVEVLSPSTAAFDLTRKRLAYQSIPSLRAVLYVHPDRMRIDLMRRREGFWVDEEAAEGPDAVLPLPELAIELPLAAVYEGVPLPEAEEPSMSGRNASGSEP
ncbi:MAG: Uma2 family endonuclease [Geminicoccaceae bacterium]|nr:Uma2 family endonuclease [Geminicoccaceae bacterium]MCS7268380.1 Uma2 family endonuclease [Geminicoccaceae bacterium]MDW8124273.1 Uma2 family endonuclease [Geminicoccaceae bacterium]